MCSPSAQSGRPRAVSNWRVQLRVLPQAHAVGCWRQVEDRGTGEYVSSFSAIRAATYRVSVTLGGINIAGSPFAAIVVPGDVSAGTSYAAGEGLKTALCGQKVRPPALPPKP